jgi:hypothetical protein
MAGDDGLGAAMALAGARDGGRDAAVERVARAADTIADALEQASAAASTPMPSALASAGEWRCVATSQASLMIGPGFAERAGAGLVRVLAIIGIVMLLVGLAVGFALGAC